MPKIQMPPITSRDPIGLQSVKLMDSVYDGARLNVEEARNVSMRGDELKKGLKALLDRLRRPRPECCLIGNKYQQKRASFDFEISAEESRNISSIMESHTRTHIHDHEGMPTMVFAPIWTPEVSPRDISVAVAESVFIGLMVIADGSRPHIAIITDVTKIDEGPDCEVFFNVSVTVSEFAR